MQVELTCMDVPQRLCSWSTGLPLFFVPKHGVEHRDYLTRDSDQSDHFGFTASEQALIESTRDGIAAAAAESRHEDRRACSWAAAGDPAFSLPLAGLARERGIPDQARNFTASEAAELREVREHGACDTMRDTREGDHQILLFAPD